MHVVPSLIPRPALARAGKLVALLAGLILMTSSWAVAAVCHGCDGGGGGGGGSTGCGDFGASTTFGQEPQISGNPKIGTSSSFSKTNANPDPSDVTIDLLSWHVGATATWSSSNASVGTGALYTPVAGNDFKYLFAKFEVSRAVPFCSEVWITNGKFIAPGDALVPTIQPQVSGETAVGSVLTTTTGTWSPAATMSVVQWRRNNIDIPGAVGTSYTLTAADLGKTVAARVYAIRAGYVNGSFTTPGVVISGNVATTIAVSGLSSASRFGVAKKGTVTVTADSGVPAGVIRVKDGATVLQEADLVNGSAALSLSKSLAVGTHHLTYSYLPSAGSLHVGTQLDRTHTVKKARTATRYKWRKKPTSKKAGILRVYVTSPDASRVTAGKVRIRVSGKTYTKTVTKGYVDIKIGKLKKGKRWFTRVYLGATSFEKSTVRKFSLTVR